MTSQDIKTTAVTDTVDLPSPDTRWRRLAWDTPSPTPTNSTATFFPPTPTPATRPGPSNAPQSSSPPPSPIPYEAPTPLEAPGLTANRPAPAPGSVYADRPSAAEVLHPGDGNKKEENQYEDEDEDGGEDEAILAGIFPWWDYVDAPPRREGELVPASALYGSLALLARFLAPGQPTYCLFCVLTDCTGDTAHTLIHCDRLRETDNVDTGIKEMVMTFHRQHVTLPTGSCFHCGFPYPGLPAEGRGTFCARERGVGLSGRRACQATWAEGQAEAARAEGCAGIVLVAIVILAAKASFTRNLRLACHHLLASTDNTRLPDLCEDASDAVNALSNYMHDPSHQHEISFVAMRPPLELLSRPIPPTAAIRDKSTPAPLLSELERWMSQKPQGVAIGIAAAGVTLQQVLTAQLKTWPTDV